MKRSKTSHCLSLKKLSGTLGFVFKEWHLEIHYAKASLTPGNVGKYL